MAAESQGLRMHHIQGDACARAGQVATLHRGTARRQHGVVRQPCAGCFRGQGAGGAPGGQNRPSKPQVLLGPSTAGAGRDQSFHFPKISFSSTGFDDFAGVLAPFLVRCWVGFRSGPQEGQGHGLCGARS